VIPSKQPAVLNSRQSGLSVVGLLIGVSISMVSILASLSLYTNHHISSSESMRGSTYNFQITQSMVIFNKEIPTAGFGLEDDGIDDSDELHPSVGIGGSGAGLDRSILISVAIATSDEGTTGVASAGFNF